MLLEGQGLMKSYGKLQVLKGVDIGLKKAEVLGILGKSGSGKSTLLHILGTLDKADSGVLKFLGKPVWKMKSKDISSLRNLNFGFIFQFHHLLTEFTALENVILPRMIAKTSRKKAETRAKELLEYVGLADRMTHRPTELSGGEKQRVAVARALINDPKVVFADEPTGNLDTDSSQDIKSLFQKLNSELQQSFIIVTHQEDVAKMCDRCLIMQDGLLIDER